MVTIEPQDAMVFRKLNTLWRQIYEAHGSLTTHWVLWQISRESVKVKERLSNKETDRAFMVISNISLNNTIVMMHQIFDETSQSYSLHHVRGDNIIKKTIEDSNKLKRLFHVHRATIKKVEEYRHKIAAHASADQSVRYLEEEIDLSVGKVLDLLNGAAECVDGLFNANKVLGMQLPNFREDHEKLYAQMKDVFATGFA